jgi:hypothetical protein
MMLPFHDLTLRSGPQGRVSGGGGVTPPDSA